VDVDGLLADVVRENGRIKRIELQEGRRQALAAGILRAHADKISASLPQVSQPPA
jgi:hypothetical protein